MEINLLAVMVDLVDMEVLEDWVASLEAYSVVVL